MSMTDTGDWAVFSNSADAGWRCANPFHMAGNLWRLRHLIRQFVSREVFSRYKGSYLGLLWSLLTPLLMLTVFTVFLVFIWRVQWPYERAGEAPRMACSLALFCGLICFNLFSECIAIAPRLILSNPNYIKKTVFPLEILPVSILGSAVVHALISFIPLVVGIAIWMPSIPWTICYVPLILFALALMTLGVSWFLASLGVFLRDIHYVIGVVLQVMFFMSPIFYSIRILDSYAPAYRVLVRLSPVTIPIRSLRNVLLWDASPEWGWLLAYLAVALVVAQLGYVCFMKSKAAFADVV